MTVAMTAGFDQSEALDASVLECPPPADGHEAEFVHEEFGGSAELDKVRLLSVLSPRPPPAT